MIWPVQGCHLKNKIHGILCCDSSFSWVSSLCCIRLLSHYIRRIIAPRYTVSTWTQFQFAGFQIDVVIYVRQRDIQALLLIFIKQPDFIFFCSLLKSSFSRNMISSVSSISFSFYPPAVTSRTLVQSQSFTIAFKFKIWNDITCNTCNQHRYQ